jgi:hypothetical protein
MHQHQTELPSPRVKESTAEELVATSLPIPLDIDDPRCPREVIHSLVADSIRHQYNEAGMPPDPSLLAFLEAHPEGRGYDWQRRVMEGLVDKPVALIENWVKEGLPRGLCRAEVRAYLKQRITPK